MQVKKNNGVQANEIGNIHLDTKEIGNIPLDEKNLSEKDNAHMDKKNNIYLMKNTLCRCKKCK